MVFAIGWSGVSVASTQSMHIEMRIQHEQMMQTHSEMSNSDLSSSDASAKHDMSDMSAAQMSSHCQQMLEQSNNDTTSAAFADLKNMAQKASCISVSDAGQIQHQQCPDCSLMACQAMIVWLNVAAVELSPPVMVYQNQSSGHAYQARHLAGHWQEILRPPKNLT
ncbi:hypothetical protein [Acinetobacter silvestris]|uniref:DUF2946 domain-containing protein n=1 Tax=Acinetobacter silvestris TaxID=1977882 RepID=A0A1Y3C857_9GAMM|nr:hypothetical protein [Acinetobacter silvestris]OTG62910.1 hypothetical protein B9T28_13930 [Acinetobacter silvestris]